VSGTTTTGTAMFGYDARNEPGARGDVLRIDLVTDQPWAVFEP
jgi:hypothetical protein